MKQSSQYQEIASTLASLELAMTFVKEVYGSILHEVQSQA